MGALKRTAMLIASDGRASISSSSATPFRPGLLRCRRARYTLCMQPYTASTRVTCSQAARARRSLCGLTGASTRKAAHVHHMRAAARGATGLCVAARSASQACVPCLQRGSATGCRCGSSGKKVHVREALRSRLHVRDRLGSRVRVRDRLRSRVRVPNRLRSRLRVPDRLHISGGGCQHKYVRVSRARTWCFPVAGSHEQQRSRGPSCWEPFF